MLALSYKESTLANGTALSPINLWQASELHGDATLTNDWNLGFAGPLGSLGVPGDAHRALIDYRVEHHLSLYNINNSKGKLITRIAGVGFIDNRIDSFFTDPIIEIPELFFQNQTRIAKNRYDFAFGKFAIRRFYNKDEIYNDPFDIGEMRFSGAIVNTMNLLARINEFRDADIRNSGARFAYGSYGFHMGVKNEDMSGGFLKRWGYQQMFAVNQLDDFNSHFYGISEVNKDWGKERPVRATLGLLYANQDVYGFPNNADNNYLIYSGFSHKPWKRFSYALRYGTLFREIQGVDANLNEYRISTSYKLTAKDSISSWLGFFDGSTNFPEDNHALIWTSVYRHTVNKHLSLMAAMSQRFNQFNPAATNNTDNDMTFFLHAQTVF